MYTLGIDIGSTTSKCAVLKDGEELVATSLRVGGMGTEGPQEALDALWAAAGLRAEELARTIVTGYGRNSLMNFADKQMSELSCHARGAYFLFPDVHTVIDIGGQDAKIISLTEDGRMANFVMNDKCAAGTGRFLDVMASILRMDVSELAPCAAQSTQPASISSTCTVFAESEVISQLASGVKRPDLVAGICQSVATRVAALARRAGVREMVRTSGGVAKNGAVRRGLEECLNVSIAYDPRCQHFGAIGAALWAYRQASKA